MKVVCCPVCKQPIAALNEQSDLIVLRKKRDGASFYTVIVGATALQCGIEHLGKMIGGCGNVFELSTVESFDK